MTPAGVRAVFWSVLEAGMSGLLSFLSTCIVARLIGPSELGLGAALVATHVLLWVTVNGLFADALVQRGVSDPAVFAGAFWASGAAGSMAAVLQVIAAWLMGVWFHDARLLPMGVLLALPLPLVGAAGAVQGELTLRRAYRALALRTIAGQSAGLLAGITAASLQAGAWAPVLQQGVISAAGAGVLLLHTTPHNAPHWTASRSLLRVGLPLTASTLVLAGRYRLFAVLIGGTAGPAVLGQLHMAFRLVDTVRELASTAQWRLMLPILAERQHDPAALRESCDRLLALSSRAMLPVCGAMALTLPALIGWLLGPAWAPSAQAVQPLIGLMVVLSLMFPSGVAVIARGEVRPALLANVATLAATLGAAMLFAPATPLAAALLWVAAQIAVVPYALRIGGRALETGPLRPLRAGVPVLAWTSGAALAVLAAAWLIGEPGSPMGCIILRLALFSAALLPVLAAGVPGYESANGLRVPRIWMRIGVPGSSNVSRNPFTR